MRINIPNRTSTPKISEAQWETKIYGKEGLKRSDPIQDRGRHPINQKNKSWKQHQPRNAWAPTFETIELKRFQEDVYFFFQQLHSEKEYQHKMSDEGCHSKS